MSIVLFHIASGRKIGEFLTEEAALGELRAVNSNEGWTRLGRSWIDGIEREWAVNAAGETGYGPYGITESERWEAWFRPEFLQQRIEQNVVQEELS